MNPHMTGFPVGNQPYNSSFQPGPISMGMASSPALSYTSRAVVSPTSHAVEIGDTTKVQELADSQESVETISEKPKHS